MALNYPGEWQLRFKYTEYTGVVYIPHEHRVNVALVPGTPVPGDAMSTYDTVGRDGSNQPLVDFIDNYVAKFLDCYGGANITFGEVELWRFEPSSFDAVFYTTYTVGLTGTVVTAHGLYRQTILSFRSTGGTFLKLDFRGMIYPAGARQGFPTTFAEINALATFVVAPDTPVIARDNGYAFAALNFLPGQNEHAFKKDLRPS